MAYWITERSEYMGTFKTEFIKNDNLRAQKRVARKQFLSNEDLSDYPKKLYNTG